MSAEIKRRMPRRRCQESSKREKSVCDEAAQNGRKLIIAIREGMEYPEPEERAEIRESLKNLILENEDFFEQTTNTGRRKDRLIRNYCSECKRQLK